MIRDSLWTVIEACFFWLVMLPVTNTFLLYYYYVRLPYDDWKSRLDSKRRMKRLSKSDPILHHQVTSILGDEEERKYKKVLTELNTSSTMHPIKSDDSDFL